MSGELKPDDCKLCGSDNVEMTDPGEIEDDSSYYCVNCGFMMDSLDTWNGLNVPLLTKARAEIYRLKKALTDIRVIVDETYDCEDNPLDSINQIERIIKESINE